MAKITAPLLSFDARGQIGKTQVYGSWRGRSYARRYTTPANPQTAEQDLTRNTFRWLQAVYKTSPATFIAPWAQYIKGKPLTERNAWTKFNLPGLREETDLANLVMSPGANAGLPTGAVVVTPGSGQLSIAIDAPAVLPTGWSIVEAAAAVILDQDPQTDTDYTISAGTDATSTYAVVITGLDAALYRVGAWFKFLRPDGTNAYSPSTMTSGTPS